MSDYFVVLAGEVESLPDAGFVVEETVEADELGVPDQLVWLVIIRDVSIPDLGPPGRPHRPFLRWMGVFVRTDMPRYVVATSF